MPARSSSRLELAGDLTLDIATQGHASSRTVVLLPGLGDSWSSFGPVLDALPPDLRVLAVSQRGHGDSSRPASGYSTADYAQDAAGLLAALGIERAVLVGHSSSTFTARLLAQTRPSLVAGLVLIASPLTLKGNPAAEAVSRELDQLTDPVSHRFVREFVAPTVGPAASPEFIARMVTEGAKAPAHVWRETFRGLLAYDDVDRLDLITAPTLLVWGDADGLVSRSEQDRLASRIRSARLLVYAGIGHSPHWEVPTRFAADLADFVHETPT